MNNEENDIISATIEREKSIIKVSIIRIITNVLLAGFKAAIGFISNSIAIVLDAVNNLSDALSSVVTIIGAKLGAKPADKKHPFGYGRVEYISSMIVAVIVLYAGITSLVESFKKIINPVVSKYSMVSIIIIIVAVVVKLILGTYVKKEGQKVNSGALIASGQDAMFDAILSTSVLISAIIYLIWNVSLEAYVGIVISIFIIKSGIEMMMDTVNDVIGHREDTKINKIIKFIILDELDVKGVYDLALFNYGPNKYYGSLHIELPDTMNVDEVDILTRRIQVKVYKKTGVVLTGIGVYSFNTKNKEAAKIRDTIEKSILSHDWALQIHGFYADTKEKSMRFDVVLSFDIDRKEALEIMIKETKELYPNYSIQILPDVNFTD